MAEEDWTPWFSFTPQDYLSFGDGVDAGYLTGEPIQGHPGSDFTIYVMGRGGNALAQYSYVSLEPNETVPWLDGPTIIIPLDEIGDYGSVPEFFYEYAVQARLPRFLVDASMGVVLAPVDLDTGVIGSRRASMRVSRGAPGEPIRFEGLGDNDVPFAEVEIPQANAYFEGAIRRANYEGYARIGRNLQPTMMGNETLDAVEVVGEGAITPGPDTGRLCLIFSASSTGGYEQLGSPLIKVYRRINYNEPDEEEPEEPEEPVGALSPFEVGLGTTQGRIRGGDGTFVFELGHADLLAEDFNRFATHEISQFIPLEDDTKLVRVRIDVRCPPPYEAVENEPYAFPYWDLTVEADGTPYYTRRLAFDGRAFTLGDIAVPTTNASFVDGEIGAGGYLPGFYASHVTVRLTAGWFEGA